MTESILRRSVAALSALALLLSLMAAFATTATAQSREGGETLNQPGGRPDPTLGLAEREVGASRTDGALDDDERDPLEVVAEAYLRVHPRMDEEQARRAAEGQEARKSLHTELFAERPDEFGGAWFDPPSGVLHVAVTTEELGEAAQELARKREVDLKVSFVDHSFNELERVAEELRHTDTKLTEAAQGRIGIDVPRNVVVVEVPPRLVDELRSPDERVVVVPADERDIEKDVCNARNDCNDSVRAGSVLWRSDVGDWCSAGITARSTATNRRYVITAGHCSNGNGVTWGTGAWTIGDMTFSADSGDLDAGAVHASWWPYAWQPGGDIYMHLMADRRIDMDGVAPSQSFIWVGDVVCLAANYTDPDAIGNRCGVVAENADASAGGKTRVDGVDACGGDSGGGWYWLVNGNRYGFGIHSSSNSGCNGSLGGDTSWFTTVPRVKQWFPALEFETN